MLCIYVCTYLLFILYTYTLITMYFFLYVCTQHNASFPLSMVYVPLQMNVELICSQRHNMLREAI